VALTESLVLVLVILTFTRLHAAVGTDVAAATDNAHALQSLEHRLHLNVELTANRWLAGHEALVTPAVILYRTYYAVLIGALLWVFLRHLDVYRQVRRTLVAMAGLALLVYWVAPVSPPRFAEAGVVDLVAEHDLLGSHAFREANNLSAMPSLHVGWSALAAYAVWCAVRARHPRGALLAWAFPLVMVADVVATGNHYVLDVLGSAVLLLVSIALAAVWRHLVRAPGRTSTAGNPSTRWI
jgi:hypothetical protein